MIKLTPSDETNYKTRLAASAAAHIVLVLSYFLFRSFVQSPFIFPVLSVFSAVYFIYFNKYFFFDRFKLNQRNWILLCLTPFWMVAFVFMGKGPLKLLGNHRYLGLAVAAYFAVEVMFPKLTFWTGTPTLHFITQTTGSVQEVMAYRNKDDIVRSYEESKSERPTSSELVMLSALAMDNITKLRNREVASVGNELEKKLRYPVLALKELSRIQVLSERSSLEFEDYSLVQWMNPIGVAEIFLLTAQDAVLKKKLSQSLAPKIKQMLSDVEQRISSLPKQKQAALSIELKAIKQELTQSQYF